MKTGNSSAYFIIYHLSNKQLLGLIYLSSVIIPIFTGWSDSVKAREIYLLPSISIRTEFDDNKRLRSDDDTSGLDKSVYGVIAHAKTKIGMRAENYDAVLDSQFVLNRFASDFDLDSDDYNFTLNSNYRLTELHNFTLSANYSQDTTLTSELDENGTGLIQGNITRQKWVVSPSWTYILSDTQFFQASFSHYQIDYEETANNQFFDFTTDTLSLSFSQQWTESLRNYISLSAMSFLVPELRRDTTEFSVNVGLDYEFSETWSTSISVGRRFTNTEIITNQFAIINNLPGIQEVTISDDTQGMIYSVSLDKEFETAHASASFSRSTSSQGNGQQRLVDSINVNYSYQSSEYFKFFLNGGMSVTTTSGNQDNINDRTYYNVRPSLLWSIDRHASLSVGYQYRFQEFKDRGDSAESHSVFFTINYQWDKLSTQEY